MKVLVAIKNFIPNLFTLINLSFGWIGIVLAFNEQLAWAGIMVFVASVFDFFDGFAARALNAQSALGKELDSLADMVAFGILPGVILYQYLNGLQGIYFTDFFDRPLGPHLISISAVILSACAGYRLAKFNIDTRQSENFIGLPTPAMAMFFASFPILSEWQLGYNMYVALDDYQLQGLAKIYRYEEFEIQVVRLFQNTTFWLIMIVLFSYLMVSPFQIVSMKLKSLKWGDNKWRFSFLIIVAVTILLGFVDLLWTTGIIPPYMFLFLPLIIVELLLVSIVKNMVEGVPD